MHQTSGQSESKHRAEYESYVNNVLPGRVIIDSKRMLLTCVSTLYLIAAAFSLAMCCGYTKHLVRARVNIEKSMKVMSTMHYSVATRWTDNQ